MPGLTAGLNPKQADRFRKAFRKWRDACGATNEDVGVVLDRYDALRGRWGEGGGAKAVANAMMRSRKLTQITAQRLVVALFLSDPGRRSEELKGEEARRAFAYESKGLGELVGMLGALKALPLESLSDVPAFVPPGWVRRLAERLADVLVQDVAGIGRSNRAAIARRLDRCLSECGPAMARAWCDTALMPQTMSHLGLTREGKTALQGSWSYIWTVEHLARFAFQSEYIEPGQLPPWGPVFALLDKERPELTQGIALPRIRKERL